MSEIKILRDFGLATGIGFALLFITAFFKGFFGAPFFGIVSAVLLILALFAPGLLSGPRQFWTGLSKMLCWINTRVILFLLYHTLFSSLGLLMRLLRIDLLDLNWDKNKTTYWLQKDPRGTPADLERQY